MYVVFLFDPSWPFLQLTGTFANLVLVPLFSKNYLAQFSSNRNMIDPFFYSFPICNFLLVKVETKTVETFDTDKFLIWILNFIGCCRNSPAWVLVCILKHFDQNWEVTKRWRQGRQGRWCDLSCSKRRNGYGSSVWLFIGFLKNYMRDRRHIHTGCICLTFLHCDFLDIFSWDKKAGSEEGKGGADALFQAPPSSADNETGSLVQWGWGHNFCHPKKGFGELELHVAN